VPTIRLQPSVRLADQPSDLETISGRTSSRLESTGQRSKWNLRLGDAEFAVWETFWRTGEREIVLAKDVVEASTPVSVSNLMARRRALVESAGNNEYMSARRVDPDDRGWPRFSNCSEGDLALLIPAEADHLLRGMGYRGAATRFELLNASDRNRNQLVGAFAPGSRAAQVGFYVLTRVVPTFHHAGLI
jgi:hypothetical protein